ncbi:MAG: hypothetical protein FWG69_00655 [Oscillospiraceae bacterium]|nr:hypothetical protein [Oscillospiraceae bacterium]
MSQSRQLLENFFDDGSFTEINPGQKTAITGFGAVGGCPVYVFCQTGETAFSSAESARLLKIYALAEKNGAPLFSIFNSKGADLKEGIGVIKNFEDIIKAATDLSGVVPQISLITGNCMGSLALTALVSDFVFMTKDAQLFLSPPFLSRDKAEDAGKAEACLTSGAAHLVCKDEESAFAKIKELIAFLPANNLDSAPLVEFAGESVCSLNEPRKLAEELADNGTFYELQKEYGSACFTAFAFIGGRAAGMIGTDKAGGRIGSNDANKAARFIAFCDAFSIPLLTLIDNEGFELSAKNEAAGSIRDAAKLAGIYAESTMPKVRLICGDGVGASLAAFSGADLTYALNGALLTTLPVEAAVDILYSDELAASGDIQADRAKFADKYKNEYASAGVAAEKGYVDGVITAAEVPAVIAAAFDILDGKRILKTPKKRSNLTL